MILEALVSCLVSYGCILIRWHIAILVANLNFMSFKTEGEVLSQKASTSSAITFFHSFQHRYNRLPGIGVADSGYGSEENYRFMQENGIEAFVKYN